jgi:hypothetical protein
MTPEELANRMAQHIVGVELAADDETCKICVELARQAIEQEREACAKVAEEWLWRSDEDTIPALADAIRARGKE